MILKFLRLPVALSVTIISSLSFFPTAGMAQEAPLCFMVNSSGQIMSLDNLCGEAQRQPIKKASICEAPFDKNGFPLTLSSDLERLKAAVAKAKQKHPSSSNKSEKQSAIAYQDSEVKAAMENLINKIPSFAQMQELQKKQMDLYNSSGKSVNPEEAKKLEEQAMNIMKELDSDPCYLKVMQALNKYMAELG